MNNARAIFDGLNHYSDIQNLVGAQEDIFLDFKERDARWQSKGKLSDDEKDLFSKAASGFAHQQGGILVWGIEAKRGTDGIDQAKTLKPFANVKQFKQALEEQIKYATEPIVDGLMNKAVFVSDDEAKNVGFVVSYIPKSNGVHRALAKTTHDFYKRHGDSFTPLSTDEIRALFFRILAPDLKLVVEKRLTAKTHHNASYQHTLGIENRGAGVARFVSAYVGFADLSNVVGLEYWDGEGNTRYSLGRLLEAPDFYNRGKHFILNGDVLIYPGQLLRLFVATFQMSGENVPPPARFKIYAEGMLPEEGEAV
jgi:hypothetical protein